MKDFPVFLDGSKSLLKKCLTPEIFELIKSRKTKNGFEFQDLIKSGIRNNDSSIGVYAGDEETYEVFAPLLDKIINEYHCFKENDKHHTNIYPEGFNPQELDPENKYIISTRIRVGRNLKNFPLGTIISKNQRREVEEKVLNSIAFLNGELSGKYYSLEQLTDIEKQELTENHFLFKSGDRFLESAGLNRDWPKNRGIFHNNDKTFLIWLNEEDHLRIISMQKGADIKQTFKRLVNALNLLEKNLVFAFNKRIGYIASCPTNLGTSMRASVHIKLPKLGQNKEKFNNIATQHHLQIRGIHGEHSKSVQSIYDISNKRRLGITEIDCLNEMCFGLLQIIQEEQKI